ncbi:MAG: PAS domain S-box protein [Rhodoferax sp.]
MAPGLDAGVLVAGVLVAGVILLLCGVLALLLQRSRRCQAALQAERAAARQAILASEARAQAVVNSSPDAIMTIDSAGCIVAFNPAAERIFGRGRAHVMGQPMHDLLVPPQYRQAHLAGMQRYLEHGGGAALDRRIEIEAMRADESCFPVELTVVSVQVNQTQFFTATMRDISAKKLAEQEKIDLLFKYHQVAVDLERQKMALDQHAIVSIEDSDETIIYANDKLVEISGYSRDELIGTPHYLYRKNLNPLVYADLRACLAAGRIWHGELIKRRRDGGSYWVRSTTLPVPDDTGQIRQFITVQTDISALRQAEMALDAARQRELEIGNHIQQSLLAGHPTQYTPDLWMSFYNQASQGIDGDFVDVIRMGEHCTDIIAGDVMGKGVPAALMGAATKLQFSRSIAELLASGRGLIEPPQPSAIMASVHRAMTPHLQQLDAFVTLSYVRIDTRRNLITWVGCGHEEPLLVGHRGRTQLLGNQHPPLGVLDSVEFTQEQAALAPGEAVFLCSDGLTDAIRPDGERIGRERVNNCMRQLLSAGVTPAAALHTLRQQLLSPRIKIGDDVTLVLLARPETQNLQARLELAVSVDAIRSLREFVTQQMQHSGLPEQEADLFLVACVEVFTNIVHHGKGLLAGAPLEVITEQRPDEFVIRLIHLGQAFTPPPETPETNFDTFPEGGFGLTIIRNACDRVAYLHQDGVNTVRLGRWLRV